MLIPNTTSYDNSEKQLTMFVDNTPDILSPSFYILNDKDKFKLIKKVETLVRGSLEYKMLITFLRNEVDMDKCTFFTNMSSRNSKVSIEIHHHPFTLFDIVVAVIEKYIDEELELNPLRIAEEVSKLHYQNLVGLIPLSKTVHQLAHDGKVFIPLQFVYGEYTKFFKDYEKWIPDPVKSSLKVLLEMSKDLSNMDNSILEPKFVYVQVEGFNVPQLI